MTTTAPIQDRNRKRMLLVGKNGEGKSPLIRKIIDENYDMRKDRVLILSSGTPLAFKGIPRLAEIDSLKKGWHGKFLYYDLRNAKNMLNKVNELLMDGYLGPGLVVLDDVNQYLDHSPTEQIKSFFINAKNMNVDLLCATHMFRQFSSWCRGMITDVTIFKTLEVFEKPNEMRELKYPNYNAMYGAWKHVMAQPRTSNYIQPHVTIKTGV